LQSLQSPSPKGDCCWRFRWRLSNQQESARIRLLLGAVSGPWLRLCSWAQLQIVGSIGESGDRMRISRRKGVTAITAKSRTTLLLVSASVWTLALPLRAGDPNSAVQRLIHTGQPFCEKKPETESTDVKCAGYMLAACELAASLNQYKGNVKFESDCAEMNEAVKTKPLTEQNEISAERRRAIASTMP
jgi:hypothetical protein